MLAKANTPPQIASEDNCFFALLASFELDDAPPLPEGSLEPEVADAPPVLLNTELLVLIAGSSVLPVSAKVLATIVCDAIVPVTAKTLLLHSNTISTCVLSQDAAAL